MHLNVGFVSTRFAGTDGVSLESAKWATVLAEDGHRVFWYAGRLDRDPATCCCVPEAHFEYPENIWINRNIWRCYARSPMVTERIHAYAAYLKTTLYEYVKRFDLQMLVLENVLTIPMHVPLGIAATTFLCETRIPAIAHHHDFYWERDRFGVNAIADYLEMAFPPRNPDIQHTVINQSAREELAWRKGVPATLIPNVFDFDRPPARGDDYTADLRQQLGIADDEKFILQPTRIVPRKGIEHSIKLLEMIGDDRYKLIISHDAGDEGYEYRRMLSELARIAGVDVRFVSNRIGEMRYRNKRGQKVYTLWDLYPHADLVTYPSVYEGFGNALLEAIYFRIPILINRYSIFTRDIEPLGFNFITIDGFVTSQVVEKVQRAIEDREYREKMVDHNYEIARHRFNYSNLRHKLRTLLSNITGT